MAWVLLNWCPRLNFNTLINIPLWLVKNGVDISISLSTRPWPNHTPLWPRPRANISKAIWRTKCLLSCLWSGWGELVLRFKSNMPFCACVCPYAYAYALVKTRLKERQIVFLKTLWNLELQNRHGSNVLTKMPSKIGFLCLQTWTSVYFCI